MSQPQPPAQLSTQPQSQHLTPSPASPPEPAQSSDDEPVDPEQVQSDPNPLNPAGDSLDRLLQLQVNDDLWSGLRGELPCLEATEPCIAQLQGMAVSHSKALKAIDQRVELVNQKIEEARKNNQATISLGVLEPAVQAFFQIETVPAVAAVRDAQGHLVTPERPARRRTFIDRIFSFLDSPLQGVGELLGAIGVPLFRNAIGGNAETQQRNIAIADLQVKIAEIENKRGEIADRLQEQVILQVLDFDQSRREFQVAQEIAKREQLRLRVLEMDYRFASGTLNTPQYLSQLSSLDRQKADVFRAWAKLRTQLTRVKLLVLGNEANE